LSGIVSDTELAPGWAAIDSALGRLYPDVEPQHLGTLLKWSLGGPDPLDGISIYERADHWHFVSYGMSELYTKESQYEEESGWGFEFTFRVARAAEDTDPPVWAANFLQNLARYVFASGNPFAVGHHMDLNGPISLSTPDTAIRAVTFAEDPELEPVDTSHGKLVFLQIIGLTLAEYGAIEQWDAGKVLAALEKNLPLLVTDLSREDLTKEPETAAAIAEGSLRDGSSTGSLFVEQSSWTELPDGIALIFGANAAERVGRILNARLPFGRGLAVDSADGGVWFRLGDTVATAKASEGIREITLSTEALTELTSRLRPVAGVYPLTTAPGVQVEIVKSHIRDPEGNLVFEVG
jgi:hypothetical protein